MIFLKDRFRFFRLARMKLTFLTLTLILAATGLYAQGTAFTYQGRLNDGAGPASGSYDLRFVVYDANANGNLIAGPVTNSAVSISNGLFVASVDFGAADAGVSFNYDLGTGQFGGNSRLGVNGVLRAARTTDIGSPGRIRGPADGEKRLNRRIGCAAASPSSLTLSGRCEEPMRN